MERLEKLISDLKKFQSGILQAIEEVVRENEEILIDYNKIDQLYEKGINSNSVPISDYRPYRPATIELKRMKGQPTNRVTLKDEGGFYASFYIEYQGGGFEIKAADYKTADLMRKYGKQIFGLSEENFVDFAQYYVKPELIQRLRACG